jgi:hypothetical protein
MLLDRHGVPGQGQHTLDIAISVLPLKFDYGMNI